MSVLKRFRTVSEYQPLTDAKDLRGQLMNWALNENNIPKKKRVLFLEDLKNICNSLVHNIKEAMKAYPKDEESLSRRKHCLSLALDDCMDLWEELQFIDDVCQQASSVMGTFKYAESYHARRNLQKTFNKLFNKKYHRRLKINGKIIIAEPNNDTNTTKGRLLY